jgi:hypothetical protein
MDLSEIYSNWKTLGFWNQSAIALTLFGFFAGVLSLAGVHMELINLAFVLLLSAVILFAKGNIDQSKKLSKANEELSHVDERISQATASVYTQKDEEIRRLEIDLATWQDRVNNHSENISILTRDLADWKDNCRRCIEIYQEQKQEIDRMQEELSHCYDIYPSLNPEHQTSYSLDVIVRMPTPQEQLIQDILNRLNSNQYPCNHHPGSEI